MLLLHRSCLPVLMLLIASLGPGCAYNKNRTDIDRTPVIHTGVGATILYPGQAPAMPGSVPPGGPGDAVEPQAAAGAPAPGAAPITFIGGAEQDVKKSRQVDVEPPFFKYARLPFALAAAPFVAIADALGGDEEPGPALPERAHTTAPSPPPRPRSAPRDYESARLDAMERELLQRQAGSEPPPVSAARGRAPSIAEELAALQRPSAPPPAPRPDPPAPTATPAPPPDPSLAALAAAHGILDRDGDGRIDQWIFREDGEIVRNLLDEDGDGRPDRTLHYDRTTHRIARVEEDTDRDGVADSWTDYREGRIVRRRADADRDGMVDSWSYYRNEEIERHESDTTGDGFRDRVRHYRGGQLVREDRDDDGDGRPELTLYYEAGEQVVRRDEDTDGDGRIDVISHYADGRLSRRELLDASALEAAPPER